MNKPNVLLLIPALIFIIFQVFVCGSFLAVYIGHYLEWMMRHPIWYILSCGVITYISTIFFENYLDSVNI